MRATRQVKQPKTVYPFAVVPNNVVSSIGLYLGKVHSSEVDPRALLKEVFERQGPGASKEADT